MQVVTQEFLDGKVPARLSGDQLLAVNDYLADAGFSIARMEVTKTTGPRRGRRFDLDILALPDHAESWATFMDPHRSRVKVKEIVDQTAKEGGTFQFMIWADRP